MMCDWTMTAPYHFFPIETVKLGMGSWELGKEGYRCKGLSSDRGEVRVHSVRNGLDHGNAAFLDNRPTAARMQVAIEADVVGSDDRSRAESAPLCPDRAWNICRVMFIPKVG